MATMPQKLQNRVRELGYLLPSILFAEMLNPKYRGSNWHWEEFVDFVANHVSIHIAMNFTDKEWDRWENQIKALAIRTGRETAQRLINESGILTWWPNPQPK